MRKYLFLILIISSSVASAQNWRLAGDPELNHTKEHIDSMPEVQTIQKRIRELQDKRRKEPDTIKEELQLQILYFQYESWLNGYYVRGTRTRETPNNLIVVDVDVPIFVPREYTFERFMDFMFKDE